MDRAFPGWDILFPLSLPGFLPGADRHRECSKCRAKRLVADLLVLQDGQGHAGRVRDPGDCPLSCIGCPIG